MVTDTPEQYDRSKSGRATLSLSRAIAKIAGVSCEAAARSSTRSFAAPSLMPQEKSLRPDCRGCGFDPDQIPLEEQTMPTEMNFFLHCGRVDGIWPDWVGGNH
jgi:hypothetical protein